MQLICMINPVQEDILNLKIKWLNLDLCILKCFQLYRSATRVSEYQLPT